MLNISEGFNITIIIPTYNRAELLKIAIQSIINQSFVNWEAIVIDDSSTDHTKEIISEFDDDRIRYVEIPKLGAAYARNLGVRLAKSHYVTFLDSDDFAYRNWLSSYADVIKKSQPNLIFSGQDYIDEKKSKRTILPLPMGPIYNFIVGRILAGSFIINKHLYEKVGGISVVLESGHWTDFSFKLSYLIRSSEITHSYINLPLMAVNVHAGDRIRNNEKSKLQGTKMLLDNHFDTLSLDHNMLRNYLRIILNISFRQMEIPSIIYTLIKYRHFIIKYGLLKPSK